MSPAAREDEGLSASVIIPVRNGAGHIDDQLRALTDQIYDRSWEVIVADNASTDGTSARVRRWSRQLPGLRVVDASAMPGAGYARNCGAAEASGDVLLFCDADDVVSALWVGAMVDALEHHCLVAGAIEYEALNSQAATSWGPAPFCTAAPQIHSFLPAGLGCNLGVRRKIFEDLGGFRTDSLTVEDIDLCWRAQLAGTTIGFSANALVHRRIRTTAVAFWRQRWSHGLGVALLYKRFRAFGMGRSPLRDVIYDYAMVVLRLPSLVRLATRYRWLSVAGVRFGRLAGSMRYRVLFP